MFVTPELRAAIAAEADHADGGVGAAGAAPRKSMLDLEGAAAAARLS